MFKKLLSNKWLVSAILLGLMVLFLGLKSVWADSVFVAIPFLVLFCGYWISVLIINYVEDYHTYFEESFKDFKAETVNMYNVTSEEFEANRELYKKKFKKSLRLDKAIDIFKILFMFSLLVMSIYAIVKFL